MFSKTFSVKTRSIVFRISLLCALLIGAFVAIAGIAFYGFLVRGLLAATDAALAERISECVVWSKGGNEEAVKQEISREATAAGTNRVFIRVLNETGEILTSSDMSNWNDIPINRRLLMAAQNGGTHFENLVLTEGKPVRMAYAALSYNRVIQAGQLVEENNAILRRVGVAYASAFAVVTLFGALFGAAVVRRSLLGIRRISETASAVVAGHLDRRVPETGRRDEIDLLGAHINTMLQRISALIREIRQVTDNVAHELKSPISRLRGTAELALTMESDLDTHREFAANVIEECDELLSMTNTMLDVAEAEAGVLEMSNEIFDVSGLVSECAEAYLPVAHDNGIRLTVSIGDEMHVRGDPVQFRRVLCNLFDNALKYTPTGGDVSVSTTQKNENASIAVRDTGTGIGGEHLPHVFERFYRASASRTRPGSGLGLSLARAIVEAHGGEITIASGPGEGTVVNIKLPYLK